MKNMKKRLVVFTLIFGMLCSITPESYVSATSDIDTGYSESFEDDVVDPCTITEDCILNDGHEGDCVLPDDYGDCTLSNPDSVFESNMIEDDTSEDNLEEIDSEQEECILSDTCVLGSDHEGQCMTQQEMLYMRSTMNPLADINSVLISPVDKISAYFGSILSLNVNAEIVDGSTVYYYLDITGDKAGLNYTTNVFSITDINGSNVEVTKTDTGCYFTLSSSSSFNLNFISDEGAGSTESSPAVLHIKAGMGTTLDEAKANVNTANVVTFTWSATSDVVSYMIDLYWKTVEGNILKDISVDTTQNTDINVTYVLSVITSSSEYEANQMEIRIPYVLWKYRDGTYCKPVEVSVPMAPDTPSNESIKYNYYLDDKGTADDELDDEIVFTNYTSVPAGTNTTIEVHYTIKPELTIDMSKRVLKAKGSCQDTLQTAPELKETDAITYQLDTGIEDYELYMGKTDANWYSYDILYRADMLPEPLRADANFESYKYIRYYMRDKLNIDIQGHTREITLVDSLCNNFEIVYVDCLDSTYPWNDDIDITNYDSFSHVYDLSDDGRFLDKDYIVYVRYPYSETRFNPTFTYTLTAYDNDSHSEADGDHNDIISKSIEFPPFDYRPYVYDRGWLEIYTKSWNLHGIEQGVSQLEYLKNKQNAETFRWDLHAMYNGNLMTEGDKQKGILYDDFHFWNLGENGEYLVMTEDDYEIDKIRDIKFSFERANLADGTIYYPDVSGDIVIKGYRNGAWEEIERFTIDAERVTEGDHENKKYLRINGEKSIKEISLTGQGFTRICMETPEVGVGEYSMYYWLDTRIKPESETLQNYLKTHDPYSIRMYNFLAVKHFTSPKDNPGVWIWDDCDDNQSTCFWQEEPPEDIKPLLAERDKAEKNYGESTDEKWLHRTHNWVDITSLQKRAHLTKKTVDIIDDTLRQRMCVIYQLDEYDSFFAEEGFDAKNPIFIDQLNQQEGIFYDLLPFGYCYDDTVEPVVNSKYDGDAYLDGIDIIDNFKDSGRQLVMFHVKARNTSNHKCNPHKIGKNEYKEYVTGFDITFSAYIPWDELVYYNGTQAINLAAFQSGKAILGQSYDDKGYPDPDTDPDTDPDIDPDVGSQANREFNDVLDTNGNPIFADIDGDGVLEGDATLYSYSATSSSVAMAIEAGIDKKVRGNSNVYQESEDVTSVNDSYSYKIGVTNTSSGVLKDLIIYDVLENAANKEGATGEVSWKGTFDYIDTSKAESSGIAPVVYYSTAENLDYNERTGDTPDDWYADTSVWSTTCPTDKSKVTAVAVDLRKKTDGSIFEVPNNGGIFFEIYMKAPATMPQEADANKIYAINRPAYSCYRQTGHNTSGEYATVIGSRVKIKLEETQLHVKKDWNDDNDKDGIRPDSITLQLKADGIPYSHTVTLSKDDNWEKDYKHLPKTNLDGDDIVWTVEEVDIPDGYTSEVKGNKESGFVVTNKHTPENIKLSGKKIWVDGNNVERTRPANVKLKIKGDDGSTYQCSASGTGNEWSWELTVPKSFNGHVINYTVEEEDVPNHYQSVSDGTDVTNTLTRMISGKKVWMDDADRDNYRPDKIVINIMNKDTVVGTLDVTGSSDVWSFTSDPLPKYDVTGKLIVYTIKEVSVPKYSSTITGNQDDGFVVTNSHENDTVTISGQKVWSDNHDEDGSRPDSITLNIIADKGTEFEKVADTIRVKGDTDTWNWHSNALPKYRNNGVEIEYTVEEFAVKGYICKITGDARTGFVITNTHTPNVKQPTIVLSGEKVWNDNSDKENVRPASILIKIIADKGTEFEKVAEELTVSGIGDSWKWISEELPKFRDNKTEIIYTLEEVPVEGYHSVIVGNEYDGFVITNTHELMPEPTPEPTPTPKPMPTPTESPEPFFIKDVPPQPPTPVSKVTAPKTGDDRIIFWMKILLISSLGIIISMIYIIRSKKRKR